ncbi:MAG: hypothetical protein JNL29_05895 [Nitrospira sp.]|nr:hypothetical protein [Nitrospira sp.]
MRPIGTKYSWTLSSLLVGLLTGMVFSLTPTCVVAQVGIASKYIGDEGIAADPDVIFAENFEAGLSVFSARFNGGGPSGIATSTDHPSASSGVQSVRLIPNGGNGTLYRQLPANYNTLYFRYYVKYLGNISHHAGGYMGGYSPPSGWPQGDAGLKGVRPNGDRLFISALEQQGSPSGGQPATRLDTYNNFVGMQGSGSNGLYYGRNYLVTENVPLSVGQWQCVEMRVKMNTTATGRDGELQIWINGTQVQNFVPGLPIGAYDSAGNWRTGAGGGFPGLQWRDVLTYGINWIKLQNYSDVGTPYDVLFDDLVVATKPIGPIRPAGGTTVPPAPTNLRVM